MSYLEEKYLNLVSGSLRNFQKKKPGLWNFSCPLCGDSKRKKFRARGYVFFNDNKLFFKCHNCSVSLIFTELLKTIDISLYQEYSLEKFTDNRQKDDVVFSPPPEFKTKTKTLSIPSIEELPEKHFAKTYCFERKIPTKHFNIIYYADDFKKFIENDFSTEKAADLPINDKRLIFPFFNKEKEIFAVQGRSLLCPNKKTKYITIKNSNNDELKIFGSERVNENSLVYVVEGPIDSLFLNNCVAVAGSDLNSVLSKYKHPIFIFDNEPDNKEIVKNMKKIISKNRKIVIWPSYIRQKDINDMILNDFDVMKIVRENVFEGLEAELRFTFWNKN